MKKTYLPTKADIKRKCYLVDAKDKILGRLAAKVAPILRGKHKKIYTPHLDTGDSVIIINASKIRVTGRKPSQKIYRRYSGYPSGLKEIPFQTLFKKKPETVVQLAIGRMLPSGRLGRDILKKLKVYAQDTHPHQAQKPVLLNI